MQVIGEDEELQQIELELCSRSTLHWIDNWVWTYDPRLLSSGTKMAFIPFDPFPKQVDFLLWLDRLANAAEDGLCEKSRDTGFTWLCASYCWHKWRFRRGFKGAFGSRKGEYVDRIGDPDSIFGKIRLMMQWLPWWMMPRGFNPVLHDNHMRLINPENGSVLRGEAGDDMGRGGRSTVYVIDEAAHLENDASVDAATSANSDCRIWGSSANGPGNLFYRKRIDGSLRADQIFRLHFRDDPRKTPEWEAAQRRKLSSSPHVFAAEYEIDYSASVEGICIPAMWVEAAKRIRSLCLSKGIVIEPAVNGVAGGDVGGGKAKSVLTPRFGPIVTVPTSWNDPDTIDTAYRMLKAASSAQARRSNGLPCKIRRLKYDSIGIGHGVIAVMARAQEKYGHLETEGIKVGDPPSLTRWPDGEASTEKFTSLKAEIWWIGREHFKCTYEMMLFLEGHKEGIQHDPSDLICLPSDEEAPEAQKLAMELSLVKYRHNEKGKVQIETKDELAKRGIASPDYADSFMLTFVPDRVIKPMDIGLPVQAVA